MQLHSTDRNHLEPQSAAFYREALEHLQGARVPFLVGGAYAFGHYTGIARHTKDFDIFVRPEDARRTLEVLAAAGFDTELTFPHWLGKAYRGDDFIDVIFSSGNGLVRVDDDWFKHFVEGEQVGVPVHLCPPEEMIWSKAFVMERERFDGADIMHLIRACGPELDWARLLDRFGPHWRVLLSHLVLFGYVYPAERGRVPKHILDVLLRRLQGELDNAPALAGLCQGTLLSREQYLPDLQQWGYQDARLQPRGPMTEEQVEIWTDAIDAK
jgi:hypothetical protein